MKKGDIYARRFGSRARTFLPGTVCDLGKSSSVAGLPCPPTLTGFQPLSSRFDSEAAEPARSLKLEIEDAEVMRMAIQRERGRSEGRAAISDCLDCCRLALTQEQRVGRSRDRARPAHAIITTA